jgi:adenosylcobinamide-GDP ribazoletransferase
LDEQATTDAAADARALSGWRALLRDFAQMLRFYSRIPVPRLPFETDAHAIPDFTTAPRMLPFAALVIGLPGAAALWLGAALGLPPLVAAAIAVAVAVLISGAFHEDGLADTFDGLGGGWTPERRLEIMKDSRIGSYGGSALMLSLILRVTALAALVDKSSVLGAALVMLAAAPLSRVIGLTPVTLLPPARAGGFSSAVGRPTAGIYGLALTLAIGAAAGCTVLAGLPWAGVALGACLGLALALAMTGWAKRAIKGQTGDIAGACQQMGEIALYVGTLMLMAHA